MQPDQVFAARKLIKRIRVWYALLLLVMVVFLVRLFQLQILKYEHYSKTAMQGQLKQYEIPATRGIIKAHDGDNILPIVLNETRYTLFADPKFISDPTATAVEVQKIIGGKTADYEAAIRQPTRYAVLAKKLPEEKKERLAALDIKGLGTRDEPRRTYPQGNLAAQVLGFVNDEGEGKYGIEQFMNNSFKGSPGLLKAITDAQGVPLLANPDNVMTAPKDGNSVVLTLDVSLQRQLEDILRAGLKRAHSKSGSALIMDPDTGDIKAMTNFPTYNPDKFYEVKNTEVFNNSAVSSPLEVGSVMKVLTASAALDQGVVTTKTTYYDPSKYKIDGYTIENIEEDGGAGTRSLADILQLSLNTGATWLLMQMGGGQINTKARSTWHDYMTNHYRLGKLTGVEQGYEAAGSIPDPKKGFGLNLQFANTAFGQGMSATPLQMAAALSSVINGGTYYRPRLIEATIDDDGKTSTKRPEIVRKGVIKPSVSKTVKSLMEYVIEKNRVLYKLPVVPRGYSIGGKTGTAEIAKPGGGYYEDRFNGTFIGFVGGVTDNYVIVVRVNEPHIDTYAGAGAAAPIFSDLAMMLINSFGLSPKT